MAVLGGTVLLNGTRVRRKVDFVDDTTTYGDKILNLGTLQDDFPHGYFNKTGISGDIPNNAAIYPKRTYLYSSISPQDAYDNGTSTEVLIENTAWDADGINSVDASNTYLYLAPTTVAPNGYYMVTYGGSRTYYVVTGGNGKISAIQTYTPVIHTYVFNRSSASPQNVSASAISVWIYLQSSCDDTVLLLTSSNISFSGTLSAFVGSIVQTGTTYIGVQILFPQNLDTSAGKGTTVTFTQPGSGFSLTCDIAQAAAIAYVFEAYSPVSPVAVLADSTSRQLLIRSTGAGSLILPLQSNVSITNNGMGATAGVPFQSGNYVCVPINYTANTTTSTRTCTVTITQPSSGKTLTYIFNQAAAAAEDTYVFSSDTTRIMLLYSATSFSFTIRSTKNGSPWTLSEDNVLIGVNLMRIICGGVTHLGSGQYQYSFSCRANSGGTARTATLTFTQPGSQNTISVTVRQFASPVTPIIEEPIEL